MLSSTSISTLQQGRFSPCLLAVGVALATFAYPRWLVEVASWTVG